MVKIESIKTKSYNSLLDSMIDEDVFIKGRLVKRLTFGEYIGEPENGFEIDFTNDHYADFVDSHINLSKRDVYIESPKKELTEEQTLILNWLIKNPVDDAPMMTIASFIAGSKWVQLPIEIGNVYGHMTAKDDIEIIEAYIEYIKNLTKIDEKELNNE